MREISKLSQLNQDIDRCVQGIREQHPDWLCGKGCDSCCKRLAEIPELTATEWTVLRQGLAALAPSTLHHIASRINQLADQVERPVVCPLLDQTTSACPVYAHRPVACRTYGFYVQRDSGLYCREIESHVADGRLADVVWGNHNVIDHRLSDLGNSRPLTEWFVDNPPTPVI